MVYSVYQWGVLVSWTEKSTYSWFSLVFSSQMNVLGGWRSWTCTIWRAWARFWEINDLHWANTLRKRMLGFTLRSIAPCREPIVSELAGCIVSKSDFVRTQCFLLICLLKFKLRSILNQLPGEKLFNYHWLNRILVLVINTDLIAVVLDWLSLFNCSSLLYYSRGCLLVDFLIGFAGRFIRFTSVLIELTGAIFTCWHFFKRIRSTLAWTNRMLSCYQHWAWRTSSWHLILCLLRIAGSFFCPGMGRLFAALDYFLNNCSSDSNGILGCWLLVWLDINYNFFIVRVFRISWSVCSVV